MNKYLKVFLKVTLTLCLGFILYTAYEFYEYLGYDGILNIFDFLIRGK